MMFQIVNLQKSAKDFFFRIQVSQFSIVHHKKSCDTFWFFVLILQNIIKEPKYVVLSYDFLSFLCSHKDA